MYDFDTLFADFVKRKGHVHEDDLGEVYAEWFDANDAALNDTPRNVISRMTDAQLVSELKEECAMGAPSLTVMEALEGRSNDKLLIPLLYEDDETLVYCAAELLRNMDKVPCETFVDLLFSTEDKELFELIVAALKEKPDLVRDLLLERVSEADADLKTVIAEILCEGGRDERVYKLLTDLFASGDNVPLYASYLARYGDERAAAMLYRALDTAKYADYIEIRNAIEAMGGIVDEDKDFSSDPDYIYLKGQNNGK